MAGHTYQTPAFAFAFQARRFACDRCHRYKLKCERGPLLMTAGIATPLGPCKRCEKAGVECMSNNVTSSNNSKRKDTNLITAASHPVIANKDNSSATTTSPGNHSSKASTAQSSERAQFSNFGTPLTDPSFYMDGFDFDMSANHSDDIDRFAPSSAITNHLPSPPQTHEDGPTSRIEDIESTNFGAVEDAGGNDLGIFDILNIPPTDSAMWGTDNAVTTSPEPMKRFDSSTSAARTFNKLSELQSFIFTEFGHISKDNIAATFLYPDTICHSNRQGQTQEPNLVEKVLSASESLIDILTSCGRGEADSSSPSGPSNLNPRNISGRKRGQSDAFDDHETGRPDTINSGSLCHSAQTADTMTAHLDFSRKTGATSSSIPAKPNPSNLDMPMQSGLLSPAKLTLLVCYVSLLGVYRSILSQAFDILRTSLPLSPPSRVRTPQNGMVHAFTPTPQPHSTQLTGPVVLRFRMQLEMLTHTLEQIDDAWAGALHRGTELSEGKHRDGVMATKVLLQSMLSHEGFYCEDENDVIGMGSLMLQVKNLKNVLRSHGKAHKG